MQQPFLVVDTHTDQMVEMVVASPRSAAECITPRLETKSAQRGFYVKGKGEQASIMPTQQRRRRNKEKESLATLTVSPLPPSVCEPLGMMESIVHKITSERPEAVTLAMLAGLYEKQMIALRSALNERQGEIATILGGVEYHKGYEAGLLEGRSLAEALAQVREENQKLEAAAKLRETKVLYEDSVRALKGDLSKEREKSALMERQIVALNTQLQAMHELKPIFPFPNFTDIGPFEHHEMERAIENVFDTDLDTILNAIAD